MTQIFDTDITLTDEQQQLLQVIKHHYIMQDQFNQLTKHVETIYERIKKLEQALANKVLS
jgi:hypothetical protein